LGVAILSRRRILLQWPALCSLTVLLISTLLGWGNVPYFCFIIPFLYLFVLQALYAERYWKWILAAALLYSLPQYAYRAYYWTVPHPGLSQRDERAISDAIDRAAATIGKPSSQVSVIANFDLWYAHPDNFVALDTRVITAPMLQIADVIVCFDKPLDPIVAIGKSGEIPCSGLSSIPSKTFETLTLHGYTAEIRIPDHPL
jgi:hypothetical protein